MKNVSSYHIFVADDHPIVVAGLKNILSAKPEINKVTTASCQKEIVEAVDKHDFDLYLLDVEYADISIFDIINLIRERKPKARILLYTVHEELGLIRRLIQENVDGIVLKDADIEVLTKAIQIVLTGGKYFSDRFNEIRSNWKNEKEEECSDEITPREHEVLMEIANGLNSVQIAGKLQISINTVETHRKKLMRKLKASNIVDLLKKAYDEGFFIEKNK